MRGCHSPMQREWPGLRWLWSIREQMPERRREVLRSAYGLASTITANCQGPTGKRKMVREKRLWQECTPVLQDLVEQKCSGNQTRQRTKRVAPIGKCRGRADCARGPAVSSYEDFNSK